MLVNSTEVLALAKSKIESGVDLKPGKLGAAPSISSLLALLEEYGPTILAALLPLLESLAGGAPVTSATLKDAVAKYVVHTVQDYAGVKSS